MSEKERRVTDEQAIGDIFDIARTTLEVHAEKKKMEHVSMDWNLARRNEREDSFLRRHMQILFAAKRIYDKEKLRKAYKKADSNKREGIREDFLPTTKEMDEMEKRMELLEKRTMMQLRNDMNTTNLIARNRNGELYGTILRTVEQGSKKEVDISSLEKIPLLGGLFKRENEGNK